MTALGLDFLGWTDEALDLLRELRGWTPEAIDRLGLVWDASTSRVVIPVCDASGDEVGVLRYDPTGRKRPKMIAEAGVPRDLFPAPELIGDDERNGPLPLVEGEADAIRLWSLGVPAVAVPG